MYVCFPGFYGISQFHVFPSFPGIGATSVLLEASKFFWWPFETLLRPLDSLQGPLEYLQAPLESIPRPSEVRGHQSTSPSWGYSKSSKDHRKSIVAESQICLPFAADWFLSSTCVVYVYLCILRVKCLCVISCALYSTHMYTIVRLQRFLFRYRNTKKPSTLSSWFMGDFREQKN